MRTDNKSDKDQPEKSVTVLKADNETFTCFFDSVNQATKKDGCLKCDIDDLDCVKRQSNDLLVQRKPFKVNRKHMSSGNPLKNLANRSDIRDQYTEVMCGIADQEKKRLKLENSKIT